MAWIKWDTTSWVSLDTKIAISKDQGGEQNTQFFHLSTLAKRLKNWVSQLRNDYGQWIDPEEWKHMAIDFYVNLYESETYSVPNASTWHFPTVSRLDSSWLNRAVSDGEIRKSIFEMNNRKALEPDGFSPSFFHKYWEIFGGSVVDFVQTAFRMGKVLT